MYSLGIVVVVMAEPSFIQDKDIVRSFTLSKVKLQSVYMFQLQFLFLLLIFCAGGGNSTNGTGGGGNLTLTVNTTSLAHSGDWVTVTWRNVHNPTSSDWIGVYLPTVSGTIDAKNHAPIKFQVRYIVTDIFYQYQKDNELLQVSLMREMKGCCREFVDNTP